MSKSVNFETIRQNQSLENAQRRWQESNKANPEWDYKKDTYSSSIIDGHEVPLLYNDALPTRNRDPTTGKFLSVKLPPNDIYSHGLSGMSTADPLDKYYESVATYGDGKAAINYPLTEEGLTEGERIKGVAMHLGKPYLDSEFFDFLQRKKELALWQDYELWKIGMVRTDNPAIREWWKKVHPDLWKKKKEHFDRSLEIKKKYAEIQMRGVESEEDLRWLYLYNLNNNKTMDNDVTSLRNTSNFTKPSPHTPSDRLVFMEPSENIFSVDNNNSKVQFPFLHRV